MKYSPFLGDGFLHQQEQGSKLKQKMSTSEFSNQFNALFTKFLDEKCSDKLQTCKEFCSGLTINNNTNKLLFSNEPLKQINDCKTFKDLFRGSELRRHWNWDEHDIIEHIITLSESEESQKELEKYKEFMAAKVGMEIIFDTLHELPHDAVKLSLCVKKPYSRLTVEEYQELKGFIFKTLEVNSYAKYPYVNVLYGSIHIDWYAPVQVAQHMINKAHVKKQVLMERCIVFVKIGAITVINTSSSENQVST